MRVFPWYMEAPSWDRFCHLRGSLWSLCLGWSYRVQFTGLSRLQGETGEDSEGWVVEFGSGRRWAPGEVMG